MEPGRELSIDQQQFTSAAKLPTTTQRLCNTSGYLSKLLLNMVTNKHKDIMRNVQIQQNIFTETTSLPILNEAVKTSTYEISNRTLHFALLFSYHIVIEPACVASQAPSSPNSLQNRLQSLKTGTTIHLSMKVLIGLHAKFMGSG